MQINGGVAYFADPFDIVENAGIVIAVDMKHINVMPVEIGDDVFQFLIFIRIYGCRNLHSN